jgi:pimeloyl-ACP methyl ester carboxylesterase
MNTYTTPTGDMLAYHYTSGHHPLVVFLGGFRSDMTGSKALALQAACEARGQAYLRFDYHGHGQSSGDFSDGSIGRWKGNALDIIAHVMNTHGVEKCVLIGSSMGGWIMTHVALALGDAVAGMIGIAAAPDFTTDLMEHEFTPQQRAELEEKGVVYVPNCMQGEPYPITRALIEDGKLQSVLTREGQLPITCPMLLLHGTRDADVPWQTSIALMDKVASEDVRVQLLKNGDHRLSEPHQLAILVSALDEILAKISKN